MKSSLFSTDQKCLIKTKRGESPKDKKMEKKELSLLEAGEIFKVARVGCNYMALDEWEGESMEFRKCINLNSYTSTKIKECDEVILL